MSKGMEFTSHIDLSLATEAARDGARKGLEQATEHILKVSNEHVPHESGDLERSGKTAVDGSELKGAVGYESFYAAFQHEDMTAEHEAGRTAKFLENAFNSETNEVGELIATAIRQQLGT